jgi:hypothetical protein
MSDLILEKLEKKNPVWNCPTIFISEKVVTVLEN